MAQQGGGGDEPDNSSLLDDVFEILNVATQLQKNSNQRIEAATKFYEAVYLMKRYVERLPLTREGEPHRTLLQDKISHYEQVAANLMAADRSTIRNADAVDNHSSSNPRSPMGMGPPPAPPTSTTTNTNDTTTINNNEKARFLNHLAGFRSEEDIPLVSAEFVTPVDVNNNASDAFGGDTAEVTADVGAEAIVGVATILEFQNDVTTNNNSAAAAHASHAVGSGRIGGHHDENGDEIPLRHSCLFPRHHEQMRHLQQKANVANAKLAQALDLDEAAGGSDDQTAQAQAAIATYMEAAELYLHALHAVHAASAAGNYSNNNAKIVDMGEAIKKRLESTLDRVEKLKTGKTVVGTSRQGDQQQSHHIQQQSQQRQLPIAPASSLPAPLPPHATLTKEEVAILKRASLIASGLFLPWSDQDAALLSSQVIAMSSQQTTNTIKIPLYTDPHGFLPLSSKQKPYFAKWARPSEICRIRKNNGMTANGVLPKPVMVHSNITPYSIKQQYVTDCSFIASLCICASFERKFRKSLITSIVYPQQQAAATNNGIDGTSSTTLVYNPAGKYMVKLWLNGVARCVVIDDYLPIDQYGNLLCSHTTSPQSSHLELWVCIIEKAYMKLCGGYDFPGSNSGVDLFSLTGWIPERFHFAKANTKVRDFETPPERAWERIASASTFGDCLITVSSHVDLSQDDADRLGLVMGHAYAVLSVIETKNGTRLLQLKNPWAHKGWKGRYSRTDTASWRDAAFRAEVGYNPELAAQNKDDGVFFICWEDILAYFQNFHLSWNPALFGYRATIHGYWPKEQGPSDDTFNVSENPQYVMALSEAAINKKATIWILISRHVCKHEQAGREVSDYLTVHLHRSKGANDVVNYPGQSGNCILTGAYTNNPHVLVRYDVDGGATDKFISLVLSQYKKANDLSYTLSCYSTEPFSLGKPQNTLPFTKGLSSALTTNGGPLGSKNVINNPMFALGIPDDDDSAIVQFKVSTSKTVALNIIVMPVESYGQRMDHATGHAVIDSGKYRHGFAITERTRMKRGGAYVVIISCYTPGQVAAFQVHVSSTCNRVKFEAISS